MLTLALCILSFSSPYVPVLNTGSHVQSIIHSLVYHHAEYSCLPRSLLIPQQSCVTSPFAHIGINPLLQYMSTLSWPCKFKHCTFVAHLDTLRELKTDRLNRSGSICESPSDRCVPRRMSAPASRSRLCTAILLRTPSKKAEATLPRSKTSHSA